MRRRSYASQLLLAVMFLACAGVTLAQDCDSLVVDQANAFGNKLQNVSQAAQKIQELGVPVYVRTFSTIQAYPELGVANTIGELEKNLERHCPDWHASNGDRKDNLVAVLLAMQEKKLLISAGPRWNDSIKPEADSIRAHYFNPYFQRNGDFAGGFVSGLGRILELTSGALNNTGSAGTQPAPPPPPPPPPPPLDLSWLKYIGYALAALLLLFGLIRALMALADYKIRQKRKQMEIVQAAKAANTVLDKVAAKINDLPEARKKLLAKVEFIKPKLTKLQFDDVASLFEQANESTDSATNGFAGPAGDFDLEAHSPKRSASRFNELAEQFQSLLTLLESAEGNYASITTIFSDAEKKSSQAASLDKDTAQSIGQAEAELANREVAGYKTDALKTQLATAQQQLATARQYVQNNRYDEALDILEQAKAAADLVLTDAKDLPNEQSRLSAAITLCNSRVDQTKKGILTGKQAFDRISAVYAPRSWQAISGNGSDAVDHVNWCLKALPLAAACITMEHQQWAEASGIITEANGHLDRADSLMQSIASLESSLKTAHDEAMSDVVSAETDLRSAVQYMAEYGNDLDTETTAKLEAAKSNLAQARQELVQPKPEFFLVIKLAKEGHGIVDEVLVECRSEHEQAERQRQKAAQAIRDATSRVSKAREYLDDHQKYVKREARGNLDDAETWLKQAQAANDPTDKLSLAEKADDAGEKAYKKAKQNVSDATESYTPVIGGRSSYYAPSSTTILVNNWGSGGSNHEYSPSPSSLGSDSSGPFTVGGNDGGTDSAGSFSADTAPDVPSTDSSGSW
jgi:uncharacterized membrane protein YgcG